MVLCGFQALVLVVIFACCCLSASSLLLTPKLRVSLRSTAGRMKQAKTLQTIPFTGITPTTIQNVKDNLARHELLLLRLNNLEKKSDAAEVAGFLCGETCSELVQIIGHTVLIYKAGNPPKLKF